jgi:5-methylcytosine-specific restriction endonuclease McrA
VNTLGHGQTKKESNMSQYKTCNRCKANKPLDEFHKSSSAKDGHRNQCKSCTALADATRYQKDAKKHRQRALSYYYEHKEQSAETASKRYFANRDETSKKRAQLRKDNIWKYKKQERASYLRNKEQKRKYSSDYSKQNPEKSLERNSRRRARLKNAITFKVDSSELKQMKNRGCLFCGSKKEINIDHIIPLSRGGSHSIGNLMPLCDHCNSTKYNKTIMEWRMYRLRIGNPLPVDRKHDE